VLWLENHRSSRLLSNAQQGLETLCIEDVVVCQHEAGSTFDCPDRQLLNLIFSRLINAAKPQTCPFCQKDRPGTLFLLMRKIEEGTHPFRMFAVQSVVAGVHH